MIILKSLLKRVGYFVIIFISHHCYNYILPQQTYRLNVKLVSENNQQHYVDAVSGDLETVEIE